VSLEPSTLALRGWTGEFLQARTLDENDLRVWHSDGSYLGRLVPDDEHTDEAVSGTVFGPGGEYLADARRGRLRVDPLRRRRNGRADGLTEQELESPGELGAVERRWPRRG
jgi:hypothetical protein